MDEIHGGEHSVTYSKNLLTITGVKEVKSFENQELILSLADRKLIVKGNALSVSELNVKNGLLRVEGELVSLSYSRGGGEKLSLAKRLFK